MPNNHHLNYPKLTSLPTGKLPPKFLMEDINSNGMKNPQQHIRNFINATTLKGVDNDMFRIILPKTMST